MTLKEIEAIVGERLDGIADAPPIAWPNQDFLPNGAYIELRHSPGERFDDTIDAIGPIQTGLFLATAVVPSGGFTNDANDLAQAIADRFNKALRLIGEEETVVITAPASFGSGFQDGTNWRQPVRISYITETNPPPFVLVLGQLDFSDPANSGLLILPRFSGVVTGPIGALDFSDPANSGLLAAI